MYYEKLQTLLHQRPFVPFRVHITDGRSYDVPYIGMALLTQSYINIGIPITKGHHPICDHVEHVRFNRIDRIEEAIASPSSESK
jgi:hypothetical protein